MPIHLEQIGPIARIVIDRPEKLNALDMPLLRQLRETLVAADADAGTRVMVLTGKGDRAFSTGMDIGGLQPRACVAEAFGLPLDEAADSGLYVRLLDLSGLRRRKPLIAAIQGFCLGGALEIALQCDIIIASSTAQFGLPEVATGSLPGGGGVGALLRALPRHVAIHMALTTERLSAERAYNLGLVSALFAPETFEADVMSLADKIARMGPLAVQMVKLLVDHTDGLPSSQWMQISELAWGLLRDTEDRAEGRQAFIEKRPPQFKGR